MGTARAPAAGYAAPMRKRRPVIALVTVLASLLLGQALAHAHLDSSEPAPGSTASGVDAVVLRFTEAVEVGFSTFKVLRLDEALAAVGMPAQDGHDHGEADHDHGEAGHDHAAGGLDPELEAQAQAVAAAALADAGFATGLVPAIADPGSGAHTELTLVLAQPLEPGRYVVAWRVLSVDTHAADGYLVFEVTD